MKRIAILGAGGFVGTRIVESVLCSGHAEVVPVIRSFKSAARLSRFGPIWRMADATSVEQLKPVIQGCAAVVNLTVGELGAMAGTAAAIWQACKETGVRQFIHMSSAEVFGRAEKPDLHDDSPAPNTHWMPYARAKISAEVSLRSRFADPSVTCVILRPGLIWGPRSPWVEGPASELASGTAYLVGAGTGVCNLIHVDNLVTTLLGVIEHPAVESGCFNVADDETTTWRQYLHALAAEIGADPGRIHPVPAGPFPATLGSRLSEWKQGPAASWLKRHLSKSTKQRLKRALGQFRSPPADRGRVPVPAPLVTRGMWHLQNTRHKLPTEKFARTYGRQNRLSFAAGMVGTGEWLRFSGFGRD